MWIKMSIFHLSPNHVWKLDTDINRKCNDITNDNKRFESMVWNWMWVPVSLMSLSSFSFVFIVTELHTNDWKRLEIVAAFMAYSFFGFYFHFCFQIAINWRWHKQIKIGFVEHLYEYRMRFAKIKANRSTFRFGVNFSIQVVFFRYNTAKSIGKIHKKQTVNKKIIGAGLALGHFLQYWIVDLISDRYYLALNEMSKGYDIPDFLHKCRNCLAFGWFIFSEWSNEIIS